LEKLKANSGMRKVEKQIGEDSGQDTGNLYLLLLTLQPIHCESF
jgi:hypothetical protein